MTFHSPQSVATRPAAIPRGVILVLALLALTIPCRPTLAQGPATAETGTLSNADLEGGFESVRGGHGSVAAHWSPWWVQGNAEQLAQGQYRPPSFEIQARASSAHGVHAGAYAQKLSSLYATHEGGFYQRVAVAPGSVARFSMWVRVWSSSSDDTERSYKPGDYRVSVGLDPYGGTDGASGTIVWSPEIVQYDDWVKLSVNAVAKASAITVFTRGTCSWRVKHNEAVWDDATLLVVPPTTLSVASSRSSTDGQPSPLTLASATGAGEATASTSNGGTPNVLQNPDFEEAFTERGAGEVTVADGWHPWWEDGSEKETADGYLFRPEYKPERRGEGCGRVHSMNAAQKQFNTYATHRAGIYQTVPVTAGSRVTFSIWAYVWSSAEDDAKVSEQPSDYRVSVGIDPTGGSDASAEGVVWSQPRHAYNRWAELTVTATAQGSAVTVFARGEPAWRVKHNDAYWDDATLIAEPTSGASAWQAANSVRSDGLVPGKARVLSQGAPTGQASFSSAAGPNTPSAVTAAQPTTTLGRRPVGNVPDVARVSRSLGEEPSLSYAGAHLSLTWQRSSDGVTIDVRVPKAVEGELALWHQGQEVARWAIAVIPGNPLAIHRPGSGLDAGDLGVEVSDSQGNVLARCGTVP